MTDVIRPPAAGRERTAPTRGPDPPLAAIVGVVLRHLGILFFVPLITFALTVWVVTSGREYYAQSRLSPQAQQSDASGLASLAATFGMGLPSARSNESLDFYADLLKSREILDSVAMTSFRFAAGPTESDTLSGTYLDLYEINGPNLNARLTRARGRLARDISLRSSSSPSVGGVCADGAWATGGAGKEVASSHAGAMPVASVSAVASDRGAGNFPGSRLANSSIG